MRCAGFKVQEMATALKHHFNILHLFCGRQNLPCTLEVRRYYRWGGISFWINGLISHKRFWKIKNWFGSGFRITSSVNINPFRIFPLKINSYTHLLCVRYKIVYVYLPTIYSSPIPWKSYLVNYVNSSDEHNCLTEWQTWLKKWYGKVMTHPYIDKDTPESNSIRIRSETVTLCREPGDNSLVESLFEAMYAV